MQIVAVQMDYCEEAEMFLKQNLLYKDKYVTQNLNNMLMSGDTLWAKSILHLVDVPKAKLWEAIKWTFFFLSFYTQHYMLKDG